MGPQISFHSNLTGRKETNESLMEGLELRKFYCPKFSPSFSGTVSIIIIIPIMLLFCKFLTEISGVRSKT